MGTGFPVPEKSSVAYQAPMTPIAGVFANASTGTTTTVTVLLSDWNPEAEAVRVNVYVPAVAAEHVIVEPLIVTLSPDDTLLLAYEIEAPEGSDIVETENATFLPTTTYCVPIVLMARLFTSHCAIAHTSLLPVTAILSPG